MGVLHHPHSGCWAPPAAGRPRMTSPANPSNNIAAALLAGARAAGPLPAVTNWPSLIEAADYHGLAPLLGSAIHPCPDEISEDDAARLRCAYRDSARRGLFLTTRLLLLLGRFEDAGISVIPLKGPVLAEMLYPDPALRPFSDLDLLVHARGRASGTAGPRARRATNWRRTWRACRLRELHGARTEI